MMTDEEMKSDTYELNAIKISKSGDENKKIEEKEKPVKIPEGYDALYLLIGYNEDHKLIMTEADAEWFYDGEIIFSSQPERHIIIKKRSSIIRKPVSISCIKDGKLYPYSISDGEKSKKTWF